MVTAVWSHRTSTKEKEIEADRPGLNYELVAFCPKCKTLETLLFTGESLVQTRKFRQDKNRVFHDCGSSESCRLFRSH